MEPKDEEPKLNSLLEPEPELRIAAPAPSPFYLPGLNKCCRRKIMVAEKVIVNCYNFNTIIKVKK